MGTLSDRRNFYPMRQYIVVVGTALLALLTPYTASGEPLHFVNVHEIDSLFGDDPINVVSSTSGPGPVAILNDSPRTPFPILKGFPGLNYINGSLFAVAASGGLLKAAAAIESAEGSPFGIGFPGLAQFGIQATYQYDDLVLTATAPDVPTFVPIILTLDVSALLSTNGVQSDAHADLGLIINLSQGAASTRAEGHVNVRTATFVAGATSYVRRSGFFLEPGQPDRVDGHASNLDIQVCGRVVEPASARSCEMMTVDISFPGFRIGVGGPFQLEVSLTTGASVFASDFPTHFLGSAKTDASHTVSFPTAGPVFILPDGVTVSSAQAKITNNRFVGGVVADTTPPTTTATSSPNPNASGWNNTNVALTLNATDNPGGSGVKEIQFSLNGAQSGAGLVSGSVVTVPIAAEGTTTLTYFARDNANNAEAPRTLPVQIDKTPPTVTFASPAPSPNAAGWNNSNVSIAFAAADSLSGLAATTPSSPLVLTTEGKGVTQSVTVTDLAGNSATFTSPAVNIDKTPPTVACVRLPRQKRNDDEDEGKLLFQVTTSDNLSQVTITLGTFQLAQGEIFQLRPSKRPGILLVGTTDDDDAPRVRRFRVGQGADVIKATDEAGNVGTAVCALPPRQGDDEKGRAGTRPNRRVESDRLSWANR
jgi:hypothetical protein